MTDLTKLSVAELRNDFASLSITHLSFKWAIDAFDELARRLEEAQRGVPLCPSPEMIEAGAKRLVSWEAESKWPDSWSPLVRAAAKNDAERCWRSMRMVAANQPIPQSKSQYKRLVAQGAIKEVSEGDKELLSKCEFIFRMGDFHSRCYAIAVALKRRIEGEGR